MLGYGLPYSTPEIFCSPNERITFPLEHLSCTAYSTQPSVYSISTNATKTPLDRIYTPGQEYVHWLFSHMSFTYRSSPSHTLIIWRQMWWSESYRISSGSRIQ